MTLEALFKRQVNHQTHLKKYFVEMEVDIVIYGFQKTKTFTFKILTSIKLQEIMDSLKISK